MMNYQMRAKKKNWYTLKAFKAEDGNIAHLTIDDAIDPFWGIDSKDLVAEIKALDVSRIKVDINSPGGSVFDGYEIFNSLRSHPAHVETRVTGLAASIASVIYMAGDTRQMEELSQIMIHRAWGMAVGSAPELRETANVLDGIDTQIINLYAKGTGQDHAKIEEMMDKETWLTSLEAQDMGFGEVISTPEARAQNLFDLSIFKNTPADLKQMVDKDRMESFKQELKEKEDNEKIMNKNLLRKRLLATEMI
jgi:ATP-dependent Clp endopeptidase proteolytic subunit ClpP